MRHGNWDTICKIAATEDGLPVRDSGPWAADKLYFWNRYIEITTKAMVGKQAWKAGVCYVDLFAGPGVCELRTTGERIPGSPLIAANAPKPFELILLCELDGTLADACQHRMRKSPASDRFCLIQGDCNDKIDDIVAKLPNRALTLAFLDPTGLHLRFNTVQKLSSHGPVDLLILFPDATDILRNADHYYFDQEESNLDHVLGRKSNWRERKTRLGSSDPTKLRELYSDIYKDQLRAEAGYTHFAHEVIRGPSGPLYRLVYATKHSKGIHFWNESVKKELGGQKRMF